MTNNFQWDWLVKITHWSIAVFFISNFALNHEGGQVHIWLGSAILILVIIRLIWGLITNSPARLSAFKPSPKAAIKHIKDVLKTRKDDYEGHNPAGAIMIWALWIGLLSTGGSGWLLEISPKHWIKETHEVLANLTFMCACIHVLAVSFMSRWTGKHYIQTMLLKK